MILLHPKYRQRNRNEFPWQNTVTFPFEHRTLDIPFLLIHKFSVRAVRVKRMSIVENVLRGGKVTWMEWKYGGRYPDGVTE